MGEAEGEPNWESSVETYTLADVKLERQWKSAVWRRELTPGLCDNLEGRDGREVGVFKREGTCVYLWVIHADARRKPTQYYKAVILQLK